MNRQLEEKTAHRVVRTFRVMKVLEAASGSFMYATYILFLDSMGVPNDRKFLLNTIFMVAGFLLDPPTGKLGDKIGHGRVYVAGILAVAAGFFVYGFSKDFSGFAIAEILAALGMALRSQALEAWMRNHTDQETFHKSRTRSRTLMNLGSILTGYAGSVIGGHLGYQIPWFISGSFFLVTAGIGMFLLWNGGAGEEVRWRELWGTFLGLTGEIVEGVKRRNLRPFFLIYAVMSGLFQPLNMLWSLVLQSFGASPEVIGFAWMGISLSVTAGTELAHRASTMSFRKIAGAIVMIGLGIAVSAGIGLTDRPLMLVLIAGFLLHEVGRGLLGELLESFRNEYIAEHERAFINSVVESFRTFGSAVGLIVFGQLTKSIENPLQIWMISAGVMLAFGAAVWFFKRR